MTDLSHIYVGFMSDICLIYVSKNFHNYLKTNNIIAYLCRMYDDFEIFEEKIQKNHAMMTGNIKREKSNMIKKLHITWNFKK